MVTLATDIQHNFSRYFDPHESLILHSEITIEIDMGRSSSVVRKQSSFDDTVCSDADDEGSIYLSSPDVSRGRQSRRAFELKRNDTQTRAEPNRVQRALKNLHRALSTSPHKRIRKMIITKTKQREKTFLSPTIRAIADSDEEVIISESDTEMAKASWEQHLFHDLRSNHRNKLKRTTPYQSPMRFQGTPCSIVTEIEDTPQRPLLNHSSSNTSMPLLRDSGQRLADIISSSEFDPFIDDDGMRCTPFTVALNMCKERETSFQSWASSGQASVADKACSTPVSLHPLNLGFVPALNFRREIDSTYNPDSKTALMK